MFVFCNRRGADRVASAILLLANYRLVHNKLSVSWTLGIYRVSHIEV